MATVSREQPEILAEFVKPVPFDRSAPGETLLSLQLSAAMSETIETLMRRTSLSKADVLNLAVGLLKAAVEAVDQGKRVGIAGDDAELDIEFTGF